MTDPDPVQVRDRYSSLLDRIERATTAAGRPARSVTLVGACKRQSAEPVRESLDAGLRHFGENRVQEAKSRWADFADDRARIELRLIGPLQTNKAEDAVALFDVIETLDRTKLAGALSSAMTKLGKAPKLLVQVNTGEEPQKAGILPADLPDFLGVLKDNYDLHPVGLMCIPPQAEPEALHFAFLKKLAEAHGLAELSMGMSGDFETAIRFGATHVRIGSALFGERASL